MRKLIVAILMSFCVSAFADEFTWADFEALCYKAKGQTPYELYGENAYDVYLEYAENPQCFIVD